MKKNTIYSGTDPAVKSQAEHVWRLCLLLVRDRTAAEELCFQSFLRLAARKEKDRRNDTVILYASACRLCEDWYDRKLRKTRGEARLLQTFQCEKSEPLYALARAGLADRIAAGLRLAGLTEAEMRQVRGRGIPERAARINEEALEQLKTCQPSADYEERLSDRIHDRFSERSVGVENAIHEIRIRFNRALPVLALLILLLFAFSVWFVRNQ